MINFKKIGLLEILVLFSAFYVISTLIWTASTRSSVEEKANLIKSNHMMVVEFVNNEINKCTNADNQLKTSWGDMCNGVWSSKKIINYINKSMKLKNLSSNNSNLVKSAQDPRLQAEGKAGQSIEIGVIFISSTDFESEPGSEWIIGTCVKSPCVAAGNNELTSVYR
tara:strand:- start:2103 stop:2603 length:501 start_codon:yes stop_codon:yes gene_type:complete